MRDVTGGKDVSSPIQVSFEILRNESCLVILT